MYTHYFSKIKDAEPYKDNICCDTYFDFLDYYNIGGGEKYKSAAAECIRNCFCLFNERGEGSCAYVYPYKVNGNKGQYYDSWANDQDFALYYYLTVNN